MCTEIAAWEKSHPTLWPVHVRHIGGRGRAWAARRPLEPCNVTVLPPPSASVRDPLREPLMDGNGTNEAIFSHSAAIAATNVAP